MNFFESKLRTMNKNENLVFGKNTDFNNYFPLNRKEKR